MDREKTYAKHCCAFLTTTCTMIMRFAFFEASPLFAKSDRLRLFSLYAEGVKARSA